MQTLIEPKGSDGTAADGTAKTLCPYCGTGCGLEVRTEAGRVLTVEGDAAYPVNAGRTCRKPLALPSAITAADRATRPLMRTDRDRRFEPVTWDKAIGTLAARLKTYAPSEIAFYVSGQLLTEGYYTVNKLAKGFLGSNNVDSNSRLCMSSAVAGYTGAFGSDGPPPSYEDLDQSDCFLLLGSNAAACHPILWSRIRDRQAKGAFVICADPRATPTATAADLHLAVRPGSDLALLNGMLHAIERDGLLDREYIDAHTSDFEKALAVAREWPPERAAEVCGVPAADIERAAHRFAGSGAAMTVWSMGANQSAVGTLKNRALINLCLATGQIGRPGCGPLSLTGQPNAMGGRETGGTAQGLPGYRDVRVPEDRAALEAHWRTPGPIASEPGLTATEIFEPGAIKVIWIVATNPVVSVPDSARVRAALEQAELVVVQDAHHPTETSALAHVVLPAAAWPEKEGVMTNSERRVGLVRKLLDPPGEARADWEIFAALGRALGHEEAFSWPDSAAVYAEHVAITAGRPCDTSGLSHARLREHGSVQWPAPAGDPPPAGSPRLYPDQRCNTPDGRARFAATPHEALPEPPTADFPLTLVTGRVADQWHTMTRTSKGRDLGGGGEPFVELHPEDAPGIEPGERVRIVSARGALVARAELDSGVRRGAAFVPFHWGALHAPAGAGQVNLATHRVLDPSSHQPDLNGAAVRVERLPAPVHACGEAGDCEALGGPPVVRPAVPRPAGPAPMRLVVVGTGMAGLAVVEEALRRHPRLSVTMLGEEPGPAYNRVRLTEILAGTAGNGAARLRSPGWYVNHGVDLRDGTPAVALDLDRRTVRDAEGVEHGYDRLVLATGSRPVVPPIPGAELPHVRVFRTTRDVAMLRRSPAREAVVVGGGLLGLEAAAGLMARGMEVTVVELGDRLMGAQLDGGAAGVLRRRLEALGLRVELRRAVERITPDHVVLDGGERRPAGVVVVAAGVRPETTVAREAGLECGVGIVVDDELRASAPGVWAVGECAEHRGRVYGLWPPLSAQAAVAGAVLAGDPGAFHATQAAATLKIADVRVYAGGSVEGTHEVLFSDSRLGIYRKLVLEGSRLSGAVLIGDIAGSEVLSDLLVTGDPVPEALLAPAGATPAVARREDRVCSCYRVTHGEIVDAIRGGGLQSVAQVALATGAAAGCGGCAGRVERTLSELNRDEP